MLSEGGPIGFGLSLALKNKQNHAELDSEFARKEMEQEKEEELKKEVNILVNQIGKMNQPLG